MERTRKRFKSRSVEIFYRKLRTSSSPRLSLDNLRRSRERQLEIDMERHRTRLRILVFSKMSRPIPFDPRNTPISPSSSISASVANLFHRISFTVQF